MFGNLSTNEGKPEEDFINYYFEQVNKIINNNDGNGIIQQMYNFHLSKEIISLFD